MDVKRWLWQISNEGHDTYGAFELPVGAAVLLSMGYAALRIEFPWLGRLVIIGLFVAALAIGHRQERRIISPGTRHRPRGILLLTSTW
ncbi:MAG: hypothetical protein FJZ90_18860, partial [Chloroflexi bacterium]|nr:hypothetical protein [Chloroflexota bacterium]